MRPPARLKRVLLGPGSHSDCHSEGPIRGHCPSVTHKVTLWGKRTLTGLVKTCKRNAALLTARLHAEEVYSSWYLSRAPMAPCFPGCALPPTTGGCAGGPGPFLLRQGWGLAAVPWTAGYRAPNRPESRLRRVASHSSNSPRVSTTVPNTSCSR